MLANTVLPNVCVILSSNMIFFWTILVPTTECAFRSSSSAISNCSSQESTLSSALLTTSPIHRIGKRSIIDVLKESKKMKWLSYGSAMKQVFKDSGKKWFKSLSKLGLMIVSFNMIAPKVSEVLDFKIKLMKNIEREKKNENS